MPDKDILHKSKMAVAKRVLSHLGDECARKKAIKRVPLYSDDDDTREEEVLS